MPKVSVIIPNYNHAPFLNQRFDSILDQTFQDFEIIFLDDASTDGSSEIFAKYADCPKVRFQFNEVNSDSPFKQWNRGINLAQGEYIWIAESDDYADSRLLEKLVQALDQNPSVGLAYSQSWEVDINSTILSTRHYWTDDLDLEQWKQSFISSGSDICRNYLILKNIIPNASAVVFRASLYCESKIENSHFRLAGDWLTWATILLQSDLAYICEPLNYYRTHDKTARKKTVYKLSSIDERLQVAQFIVKNVDVPRQKITQASESLLNWLVDNLLEENTLTRLHLSILGRIFRLSSQRRLQLTFCKQLLNVSFGKASNKVKHLIRELWSLGLINHNG